MEKETRLFRNPSKTRKLIATSGVICLLLLGCFLYGVGIFDGVLKIKLAVGSGAVFVLMFVWLLKSMVDLRDTSPRIVLTETTFSGKTTPLSQAFGEGSWDDVRHIQLQKVGGDILVVVSLGNTQKYAGRLSKMFWKMAYHEQEQLLHVMYSASEIDRDAQSLYALFTAYWEASKQPPGSST